jgi:hypothetical protein
MDRDIPVEVAPFGLPACAQQYRDPIRCGDGAGIRQPFVGGVPEATELVTRPLCAYQRFYLQASESGAACGLCPAVEDRIGVDALHQITQCVSVFDKSESDSNDHSVSVPPWGCVRQEVV